MDVLFPCGFRLPFNSPQSISAGLRSVSSAAMKYLACEGKGIPKIKKKKYVSQGKLCYYAADSMSRLHEWLLWGILFRAKISSRLLSTAVGKVAT
jgi:hypothetical protein